MAHRRLVEAINDNRILYDSNPQLIGYGRHNRCAKHNSRVLVGPGYSRYSYQRRRDTPLPPANNRYQSRNNASEHDDQNDKQKNEDTSERVLQRIVVTHLNSVSYKIPTDIQIKEHTSMGPLIDSGKNETNENAKQQIDGGIRIKEGLDKNSKIKD
jgi:hypothetical protein